MSAYFSRTEHQSFCDYHKIMVLGLWDEHLLSAWFQIYFVSKMNFSSLRQNQKLFSSFLATGIIQLCSSNSRAPSSKHQWSHKPNFDYPQGAATNVQINSYIHYSKVLPKEGRKYPHQGHTVHKCLLIKNR